MRCRAMQALWKLALEPVAETLADPNSYGFRPERSTADAIEQCFIAPARRVSPQWILEGDIRGCFDNFSHLWLQEQIPMDKVMLRKWLEADYIDEGTWAVRGRVRVRCRAKRQERLRVRHPPRLKTSLLPGVLFS